MSKIGLLFPGQGSQSVGMGKELIDTFDKAKEIVDSANDYLGFNLTKVMLEGPDDDLKDTSIAQPAILTASVAAWEVLKSELDLNNNSFICAGHSLGEYSALVAAGAIDFKEAVKLVYERGRLMKEAASGVTGGMAAVIGPTEAEVMQLCQQADQTGDVQVANLNCPGQTVISGSQTALDNFSKLAQENSFKFIPLAVSGPFHSTFMKPAAEKFKPSLAAAPFRTAKYGVIANVSASPVTEPDDIRESLAAQIYGSVRWTESMNAMIGQEIKLMIEVGPGKVLKGLMKKINKDVKVINAFSPDEINKVKESVDL